MKRLLKHERIALDLDKTLIEGGIQSRWLWDFVRSFHREKKFWIITFRPEGLASRRFIEMDISEHSPLSVNHFHGVICCPEHLSICVEPISDHMNLDQIELACQATESEFVRWKGSVAKSLGCTVLVDDKERMVKPGCDLHGIEFINTLDLNPDI
jgi:hypothetical protein